LIGAAGSSGLSATQAVKSAIFGNSQSSAAPIRSRAAEQFTPPPSMTDPVFYLGSIPEFLAGDDCCYRSIAIN